jgi:hypothetical protein
MWFPSSLLARTFASPCIGYEPKARVTTLVALMLRVNILLVMAKDIGGLRLIIVSEVFL